MQNLGWAEILAILFIVILLFGSKKIPELAQGLGKGIREFRKAAREIDSDDEQKKTDEKPPETK